MRMILILLVTANLYAADSVNVNIHSEKNILRFADFLYQEKDYLRASEEYKMLAVFGQNDTSEFKYALSLGAMGKYAEAEKPMYDLSLEGNLKDEAIVELYKMRILAKQYAELRKDFEEKKIHSGKSNLTLEMLYIQSLLLDPFTEIKNPPDFQQFPSTVRSEASALWNRKLYPEYKNPFKAALLSALLPGAGKIYTGEYSDAAVSLLFTGLFSYLAVYNFIEGKGFKTYLFSGLAAYFYAGNIYGSASSARIYNYKIDIAFDSDLNIFLKKNNYFTPAYENFFK